MNKEAQKLGKLGGRAKAKKYPHSHYIEIGRRGATKRWGNPKTNSRKTNRE